MVYYPGILAAGTVVSALIEESSTKFARDTTAADPWDDTVTIPSGSNRILLDFIGVQDPQTTTSTLDPASENITLTQDTNSPAAASVSDENVLLFRLLEASFGTTGAKTLRANLIGARVGRRRVVILSGASQTLFSAKGTTTVIGLFTVTCSRGAGTFPAGSRVYAAAFFQQGAGNITVGGDVTELDDEAVASATSSLQDKWTFATGILTAAQASVNATFQLASDTGRRKQAIVVVVEP